jgi:hypothetical protein
VNIDLLDPASPADGQPHEQYRWLRDNAPSTGIPSRTALVLGRHPL